MVKTEPPSLATIVARLAHMMEDGELGTGDLAGLRRLDADAPAQPAFWKIMAGVVAREGPLSATAEGRWACVLSGMARMAPHHNDRRRPVGRVLAEAGYSETRLMRLLRADWPLLGDHVRRLCGFLASKAEPLDWLEFASFILSTDPTKSEEARRRIARDYYSSQPPKEAE